MLDKQKVLNSLEAKKNEFISSKDSYSEEFLIYRSKYEELFKTSYIDITKNLTLKAEPAGALPTYEWNEAPEKFKFKEIFENHVQARKWAYETLLDQITFAVDGSQILPSKDFQPIVAAVQVAKYENFHSNDGLYIKDLHFEVISSQELLSEKNEKISRDHLINYKRFELEINTLIDYIKSSKENNLTPIVFYDGSLIVTFITAEGATSGNILYTNYINKIYELLDTAQNNKMPIIGYIDTSGAHDILDMLNSYYHDLPKKPGISDTNIINHSLEWGDRTPVFRCDRPGVLKQYREHKDQICFTYLKSNNNLPARLEFPLWLFEDKILFEKVINIARAEIIIGSGYVYSIESADAAAVLTNQDRKQFYKIFSEFAYQNKLNFNIAQKSLSKQKRR